METLKPAPVIEWGVASRALFGETVSGDQYLVETFENGALAAVVDGLGHGAEASAAAQTAIEVLRLHAAEDVVTLVQRCHAALRQTRGAALSLVSFDAAAGSIHWVAVGNVEGVLLRKCGSVDAGRSGILLRSGVVGYQLPALRADTLPVAKGDLLILATDGIANGFVRDIQHDAPVQTIADHILAHYGRSTDDTLVLVIRYRGSWYER